MKLNKTFFVNILKPSNWYYAVQGYYRKWFDPKDIEYKKRVCKGCWDNGECLVCQCDIEAMFNSNKPCPRGRF